MPFSQLGLPSAAESFFINVSRTLPQAKLKYRNGQVTSLLAFRVGREMLFGRKTDTDLARKTWGSINRNFFGGMPLYMEEGRFAPVEVRLSADKPFADGDTARVEAFLKDGEWFDTRINIRMDGIDTAESNPSEKLNRQKRAIAMYLSDTYGLSSADRKALEVLIGLRIVYSGKIANVVTTAFGHHFAETGISLAPAYTILGVDKGIQGSLDYSDKYGRLIARVMAGGENQGEELLAGFIEAVLPRAMKDLGSMYLAEYKMSAQSCKKILAKWRRNNPELYDILAPETAPVPSKIFSAKKCAELAARWTQFYEREPLARNDLQTMEAFLGVAPPYPKYSGDMTPMDLRAEWISLGGGLGLDLGHGLNQDELFRLIRPSGDPATDPYYSPVFYKYGKTMSDIENIWQLDPLNLRAALLPQNG
jgi:hypothetical protein